MEIDQTPSGTHFVDNIVKKVNNKLRFLYRQCKSFPCDIKRTLCIALVMCHFDYCCAAWYHGLSKNMTEKLQVAQNKCIRFIKGMASREPITGPIHKELKILNVEKRVKQMTLNHMFNIYYQTAPKYLSDKLTRVNSRHDHATRNSTLNFNRSSSKGQMMKTFSYNGVIIWNELPADVKQSSHKRRFKYHLKQFLFNHI